MGVLCAIFAFSFVCRAFFFYPLPCFISSTRFCISVAHCFVPRALFCITLSSASYSEYPAHCFAPKDGAQYPSQGPPCYQRYWAKASKRGHFYQMDDLKLALIHIMTIQWMQHGTMVKLSKKIWIIRSKCEVVNIANIMELF